VSEAAQIESLDGHLEMGGLDLSRLNKTLHAYTGVQVKDNVGGTLKLRLNRLMLDANPFAQTTGTIELQGGVLGVEGLSSVERLDFTADLEDGRIRLKKVDGNLAGGTFSGAGDIQNIWSSPRLQFQGTLKALELGDLLEQASPSEPQFHGTASGTLVMTGVLAQFFETMQGEGTLQLPNGVLQNMNLLREVFGAISIIPQLSQRLMGRLSPEYQERFNVNRTVFAPIELKYRLQNSALFFDSTRIATEDFELICSGRIQMDETLEARGKIRLHAELSNAIIRSVTELGSLANAKGELVIPVTIKGTLNRWRAFPDVGNLATQFAVKQASQLLQDLL